LAKGPNTKLNQPSSIAGDVAYDVWVTNAGDGSVSSFDVSADGNVAPLNYIAGPNTTLLPGVTGIAYAQRSFSVLVCNTAANAIVEFYYGASGNVAPALTISGALTGLNRPDAIFVDDPTGKIYVANAGSGAITVYAAGASGNAAPLATISGPATTITTPIAIGVR
jgi:DNA-binding beta-propeller fold protein YncE